MCKHHRVPRTLHHNETCSGRLLPDLLACTRIEKGLRDGSQVRMIMRKLHYIAQPSLLHDTAEGKNDCMKQRLQKVLAEREKAGE